MRKKEKHEDPVYTKNNNRGTNQRHRSKSQHSILHKHYQKLEEFRKKNERLHTLDNKITSTQQEIVKLEREKSVQQLNNSSIDNVMHAIAQKQEELKNIQSQHAHIKSGQDEIDYLLDSSQLITQFLNLDDQEKTLLAVDEANNEQIEELNQISYLKANLTDDYLTRFEENFISTRRGFDISLSMCLDCKVKMEIDEGFSVCPSCGSCFNAIEHSAELSFKELQTYDYRAQFTYEKSCHLDDWLRRFQAKEHKTIPQEILDKVILEARKERIRDLNLLTEDRVKRYLKRLSLNEYYDNIIGIINRINGRPPFNLTQEIEDKIKTMFQQIQEPFEKYKPPTRRNFLSYSYTLHKFFQILGLHEFSTYFPLLKSADKLRQQDDIFRKIVAEMAEKDKTINWVFYPSI
jgi:rubrerythrin